MHGCGRWGVRYSAFDQPSFGLVLKGRCWLAADGVPATTLETGDFVLFPVTPSFTMASDPTVKPRYMNPIPSEQQLVEVVHGEATTEPSVSVLGGYFSFDPINASLLLDALPRMLHIQATDPAIGSVASVVELVKREAWEKRAGQAFVLTRLVEIMLVEAVRSAPTDLHTTGLLAGLHEPQLAAALRGIQILSIYKRSLSRPEPQRPL